MAKKPSARLLPHRRRGGLGFASVTVMLALASSAVPARGESVGGRHWVYFKDKGVSGAALGPRLDDLATSLAPRTVKRRLKTMGTAIVDAHDLLGGVSVVYDTLRSGQPGDFVTAAECLETNGTDTLSADPLTPAPQAVFFHLVRAENGCQLGQGSLGVDSNGVLREGRSCP